MAKECELYDRFCIECGECEICDLDNLKKCDNCCCCIGDTGEYGVLKVNDFLKESGRKTYKLKK